MNAVLINPPRINQVWAGVPDIFNSREIYLFPPLGIMYLASALKKKSSHKVHLIDAQPLNMTAEETAEAAIELNPDLVGISTQTHNLVDVYRVMQVVKEKMPDVHLMLGGPHCWSYPDKVFEYEQVDSILKGDGEDSLPQWLDALENGSGLEKVKGVYWKDNDGNVVRNERIEHCRDIDDLPFPDRDLLPLKYYYTPGMKASKTTTMITSRGCPHNCSFCNTYTRYSVRSAKNIVDEMEECRDRYGIEEIHFIDDLFNGTAQRVIEISEEILNRNLKMRWGFKATCRESTKEMVEISKEAGCTKIHYGVETGTNQGLQSLNKKLTIEEAMEVFNFTKAVGITTVAYMMLGTPHERSSKDVDESIRFIRKLDPDYVVWALMSPYPDTKIFKKGAEMGLYPADCWDRFMERPVCGDGLPTVWEEHMKKDELVKLFKKAHRDFYFNPGKVLKTVTQISTMEELKRIFRGGLALIKMEFLAGDGEGRI